MTGGGQMSYLANYWGGANVGEGGKCPGGKCRGLYYYNIYYNIYIVTRDFVLINSD